MTFEEFYTSIYDNENISNPREFIEYYEPHKELVNTEIIAENTAAYNQVLKLKSDYAHYLTLEESYRKALPEIELAIKLFENYPGKENEDHFKAHYYETLTFDNGISNYRLKNDSEAKKIFETLSERFPDNDKYKLWLGASKTRWLDKLLNIMLYTMAIALLGSVFLDKADFGFLHDLILYVGALALGASLFIEILRIRNRRKLKNGG